jgi:Tol biopolymer transport system component
MVWVNAEGSLVVAPFSSSKRDITAAPLTLLADIAVDGTAQSAFLSVSAEGTLVYLQGSLIKPIVRVERDGSQHVLLDSVFAPLGLRFSPSGDRIAMEAQIGRHPRIWVYDLNRGTNTAVTFDGVARYPSWHPRQNKLLFSYLPPGTLGRHLYEVPADGSGSQSKVFSIPRLDDIRDIFEGVWMPDERHLIVRTTSPTRGRDIWVGTAMTDSIRELARMPADERAVAVSPNGRWVAYTSDESTQSEIYVRSTTGPGKWQVSRNSGTEPAWSRDGRELFYRDAQSLVAVSVETESATFVARTSRSLFADIAFTHSPDHTTYDVDPTGRWFAMIRNSTAEPHLMMIQNFRTEINARR